MQTYPISTVVQPGKGARTGHCKKGWWLLRAPVRCRVCPAVRNCPLQMWMVRNLIRQAGQSLRNLSAGFVGSDGALHLRSSEQGRACGEPAAPPGWPVSLDHTSPGLSFLWTNRGKVWALPSRGTVAAEQHSLPCSGMLASVCTYPWQDKNPVFHDSVENVLKKLILAFSKILSPLPQWWCQMLMYSFQLENVYQFLVLYLYFEFDKQKTLWMDYNLHELM